MTDSLSRWRQPHDFRHGHLLDLHVWRVGLEAYACIATIVTRQQISADALKLKLSQVREIRHVTIEVNQHD